MSGMVSKRGTVDTKCKNMFTMSGSFLILYCTYYDIVYLISWAGDLGSSVERTKYDIQAIAVALAFWT